MKKRNIKHAVVAVLGEGAVEHEVKDQDVEVREDEQAATTKVQNHVAREELDLADEVTRSA